MDAHPFAALSLIVAPAILTNASTVLAMSTSSRLARAVDRARELSRALEGLPDLRAPEAVRRLEELEAADRRTGLLVRALQSFYVALGAFASATLVSLLGLVLLPAGGARTLVQISEALAVLAGLVALGALVYGSVLLVRETRIAVQVLRRRAADLHARAIRTGHGDLG